MPTTKKIGYICTCGEPISLWETEIATCEELDRYRARKHKEWTHSFHVHAQATGGCNATIVLTPDRLVLLELQKDTWQVVFP